MRATRTKMSLVDANPARGELLPELAMLCGPRARDSPRLNRSSSARPDIRSARDPGDTGELMASFGGLSRCSNELGSGSMRDNRERPLSVGSSLILGFHWYELLFRP